MKNKTKKIFKILSAMLLIIVLQTMGYTYAKYVTEEKGIGRAEIAKWSFEMKKDGEQIETIKLEDTIDRETLVDGKIAPGTTGAIMITLDGTESEVNIDYNLKFANENDKPNNLEFIYNGTRYKSLSSIGDISGTIEHDAKVKTSDIVIVWEWKYETGTTTDEIAANDVLDTQDANTITEYTFDVIATGTQSI